MPWRRTAGPSRGDPRSVGSSASARASSRARSPPRSPAGSLCALSRRAGVTPSPLPTRSSVSSCRGAIPSTEGWGTATARSASRASRKRRKGRRMRLVCRRRRGRWRRPACGSRGRWADCLGSRSWAPPVVQITPSSSRSGAPSSPSGTTRCSSSGRTSWRAPGPCRTSCRGNPRCLRKCPWGAAADCTAPTPSAPAPPR